jgi:hypothetical protein
MTTPPEHMRLLIALLESTTVEAQKPTRNSLLARQRNAFLRTGGINLGPNFSWLETHIYDNPPCRSIELGWRGAGDYSKLDLSIQCFNIDPLNQAHIELIPHDDDDFFDWQLESLYEANWKDASAVDRDKIAQAICGNIGIVPGSMNKKSGKSHSYGWDIPRYWFRIAPGSTLDKMTKLMPETDEQAEELERIFNKGKPPT